MRILVLAVTVSMLATGDAAAQPPPSSNPPPIGIDQCTVLTNVFYPWGALRYRYVSTAGLKITFHDRANQKATAVRFIVNYRGDVETIDDAGSFSPGVSITHTYEQFVDFAYLGTRPNFCRIDSVKLADGTSWSAEALRPQAH